MLFEVAEFDIKGNLLAAKKGFISKKTENIKLILLREKIAQEPVSWLESREKSQLAEMLLQPTILDRLQVTIWKTYGIEI